MQPRDNSVLSPSSQASARWLIRGSKAAEDIAAFSWENTPFGKLDTWPGHLRWAVNLVLEAGTPMAVVWGKEFRFLYNDQYADTLQDKHPAALGQPGMIIFPELWPAMAPLFNQALSGKAVCIDDHQLKISRRGTTETAYFSFSFNPIRSEAGLVDGFLAVVMETTSRVVREQQRSDLFDTVLSSITDFAYAFDRDGRFVYVNKALLDLWGLRLEQAVGRNFFELNYPPELATRLQRQIQQVVAERIHVRDETTYTGANGIEGFYEYIFSPVCAADGTVTAVAGSTRDFTLRRNLQLETLAASKAKDDFLAMLSHELRTPLNPVLLLATEGSNNSALPEEVRADFKSIAHHVELEASMIDDLLDISRITHDKLQLDFRKHHLNILLLRAMAAIEADFSGKNLIFTPKFEAVLPVVVADELRLHQLFSNLLRNAAKFTPHGGHITISTQVHASKPDTVVIEITDTGIGLSPVELKTIFTPFLQGEHTNHASMQFGGLGLGLAISRKIVESHSGRITARSSGRNLGATFIVELPLEPAGTPSVEEERTFLPASPKSGLRVLLVEDHPSSRQALARLLANRKIEVIEAANATEALAKAQAHPFDLVISDIGLPDINGYELMKQLKATYGCSGFALTGYGSQADIAQSKAAGFTIHLTKPVQTQALDDALTAFSL